MHASAAKGAAHCQIAFKHHSCPAKALKRHSLHRIPQGLELHGLPSPMPKTWTHTQRRAAAVEDASALQGEDDDEGIDLPSRFSTDASHLEDDGAPDPDREFAVAMAKVADDTKGEDVMVLHVAPLVYWTSYMVFITVFSRPQLMAMLARMSKEAGERWDRQPMGTAPGRGVWECLDFGGVVVHVLTAEQREFYDIESFYATAEEVELPFLNQEQGVGWTSKF